MTRYLERLFAGEEPSAGEWNEHLVEFHRTVDDVMLPFGSLLRTFAGETSYEYLARRLAETMPSARAVLDVGCGNGTLLQAIEPRFGAELSLHGVDLSEREVERARERVPRADVRVSDVAVASFAAGSFDAIVGHLSLRSIANVRAALTTMRRALKPNGELLALLEEPWANANLAQLFGACFEVVRNNHAKFSAVVPASEMLRDDQESSDLLRAAGFAGEISSEAVAVVGELTAEQAYTLIERIYHFGLLSQAERDVLRDHVMKILAPLRSPNGLISLEFPMRLLFARAT